MANDPAPRRQALHVWAGPHEDTEPHRLGDIEHTCPCDPTVMEWHDDHGWVTVHPGSRQ